MPIVASMPKARAARVVPMSISSAEGRSGYLRPKKRSSSSTDNDGFEARLSVPMHTLTRAVDHVSAAGGDAVDLFVGDVVDVGQNGVGPQHAGVGCIFNG